MKSMAEVGIGGPADAVQTVKNTLTINVTNTWRNRLIDDAALPLERRTTWTWHRATWFSPRAALEPVGWIGPIKLKTVTEWK